MFVHFPCGDVNLMHFTFSTFTYVDDKLTLVSMHFVDGSKLDLSSPDDISAYNKMWAELRFMGNGQGLPKR